MIVCSKISGKSLNQSERSHEIVKKYDFWAHFTCFLGNYVYFVLALFSPVAQAQNAIFSSKPQSMDQKPSLGGPNSITKGYIKQVKSWFLCPAAVANFNFDHKMESFHFVIVTNDVQLVT